MYLETGEYSEKVSLGVGHVSGGVALLSLALFLRFC